MKHHDVWLAWSSEFLLPWLALYGTKPRFRSVMWRVSLVTSVFGLTERHLHAADRIRLCRHGHFSLLNWNAEIQLMRPLHRLRLHSTSGWNTICDEKSLRLVVGT